VRIVDEGIADVAEALARDLAATAVAAGEVPRVDLDELVAYAEAKSQRLGSRTRPYGGPAPRS